MTKPITKNEALEILDCVDGKYEPIGQFFLQDGGKYIGIDNRTGDAWTEEFDSLRECLLWLSGHLERAG